AVEDWVYAAYQAAPALLTGSIFAKADLNFVNADPPFNREGAGRAARPAQIIAQGPNIRVVLLGNRCEEAFAYQARVHVLEIRMDAARRALPIGHCVDDQARPKCDVAAREDARRGGHQRFLIDHERAAWRDFDGILRADPA